MDVQPPRSRRSSMTLPMPEGPCALCGKNHGAVPLAAVRPALSEMIQRSAALADDAALCRPCLTNSRIEHARTELKQERGELSAVEELIARQAAQHIAIAERLDDENGGRTHGQRLADAVARLGGSWTFIAIFSGFLVLWAIVNGILLGRHAFDPYPFVFLNLVLSCVAALQAPIIMMSQSRQASRDRKQAEMDYRVNLKAELEIATLHHKVDHLLHQQWQRMVEMQDVQLEILEELRSKGR